MADEKSKLPGARGRGRPRREAQDVGVDRLIEAARGLLRSRQLARLTHTEVANAASVSEKLVRYYFEKPDKLLEAVLAVDIDAQNRVMTEASSPDPDAKIVLRRRLEALSGFVIDNPTFFKLLVERVYSGEGEEASTRLEDVTLPAFARHRQFVENGRDTGQFRTDFELRFLYVAIIALAEIFVTAQPVFELLFAGEERDLRAEYQDFIYDLILRGIQA